MPTKFILPLFLLVLVGAGCFGSRSSGRDAGVFKSDDAGKNWTQTVAFPGPKGVGSLAAVNVESLVLDPSDQNALYLGTQEDGLFFSYDGAVTWQRPREKILQTGKVISIAVDPKEVCTIYVVRDRSVYKTSNCSRSFERIYDETRTKVSPRRLAVDWYNPLAVYLGLSNGDVLKSQDGGTSWTKILSARDEITDILVSAGDSRTILVATETEGIMRSADGGESWESLAETLKKFDKGDNVSDLVQTSKGDVLFASTAYGLLRSHDLGDTWSALSLVTSPGQVRIRALAINPQNAGTIYYATSSTFYKSTDGGATWDTQRLPSSRGVSQMQVSADDPDIIYIGMKLFEEQKKGL